jgi:hypothetical protein
MAPHRIQCGVTGWNVKARGPESRGNSVRFFHRRMIIQRVIKGINGLNDMQAAATLSNGIVCNWGRTVTHLPLNQIPLRLTDRNLEWHQNHYSDPDPLEGGEEFRIHTPFISTTAGTVERDAANSTNIRRPAWEVALRFATNFWTSDGYLFHCYLFVLGRPSVKHQAFAEELRELNIYTGFSPFQPEGEVTAKIGIPPAQIEKAEFWSMAEILHSLQSGSLPAPTRTVYNGLFVQPSELSNMRDYLR